MHYPRFCVSGQWYSSGGHAAASSPPPLRTTKAVHTPHKCKTLEFCNVCANFVDGLRFDKGRCCKANTQNTETHNMCPPQRDASPDSADHTCITTGTPTTHHLTHDTRTHVDTHTNTEHIMLCM
mmetsp:Transcript_45419/g.66627  ORF Transcript_45419/g.66627 Transcript_45419/m.66627 type:complete len:124 (-) Transcript_45419:126-497(-)